MTTVISYTFLKRFAAEYELDYQKATTSGVIFTRNRNDEWSQNFKLAYIWDAQWRPYVEVMSRIQGRPTTIRLATEQLSNTASD